MQKKKNRVLLLVAPIIIAWCVGFIQMATQAEVPMVEPDMAYISIERRMPAPTPPPVVELTPAPLLVAYADTEEEVYEGPQNIIASRSVGARKYDRADLTLLATLISGEAEGESYDGKLAVGTVVMNRMAANERWMGGNTLEGVIFAKGQFQCTWDNWHTPDADSLRAAQEVLNGYRSFEDDIVFFHNPVISTNRKHVASVRVVYVIGGHEFGR